MVVIDLSKLRRVSSQPRDFPYRFQRVQPHGHTAEYEIRVADSDFSGADNLHDLIDRVNVALYAVGVLSRLDRNHIAQRMLEYWNCTENRLGPTTFTIEPAQPIPGLPAPKPEPTPAESLEEVKDPEAVAPPRKKRRTGDSEDDDVRIRCAVCLEHVYVGAGAYLMRCSHMFHRNCIGRWLRQSRSCPVCRFEF